jgi:hypothetical protein
MRVLKIQLLLNIDLIVPPSYIVVQQSIEFLRDSWTNITEIDISLIMLEIQTNNFNW